MLDLLNFKFIVFENLLVKISEILLIFDFVNNKSDLDIYTLVIGISMCFGYLLVFPFVIHTIKPVKISTRPRVTKHGGDTIKAV